MPRRKYCIEKEKIIIPGLFLKKHKPMLVSKTLGGYEDLLEENGFLRIHKSHLVNSRHISKVDRDGLLLMNYGKQLVISKRRKEMVMNKLKQH